MSKGYLAFILHAHLPYVRHTEYDSFLEERGLSKGNMQLIDTGQAESLYAAMGPAIEVSGGGHPI